MGALRVNQDAIRGENPIKSFCEENGLHINFCLIRIEVENDLFGLPNGWEINRASHLSQ
jgi:hypothetical protein